MFEALTFAKTVCVAQVAKAAAEYHPKSSALYIYT
jgi:hypothetical protein